MSDNLTNTELLLKAVLQEIKWVKIALKQKVMTLTVDKTIPKIPLALLFGIWVNTVGILVILWIIASKL